MIETSHQDSDHAPAEEASQVQGPGTVEFGGAAEGEEGTGGEEDGLG